VIGNEVQNLKDRGVMSLLKPKAVYVVSKQQYIAAGGEVQVTSGVTEGETR